MWLWGIVAAVLVAGSVLAEPISFEDVFDAIASNVDLKAVTGLNEQELQQWKRNIQEALQGEYVIEWGEEELEFVIPPPRLELPVKPPVPPLPAPIPVPRAKELVLPARARALVPWLKPVFAAAGVPPELVWVAEVESRFDPRARSRSGAVGLYQLMPATAEWLGLSVGWRDERLDPVKNAQAGARYLRYLYRKFHDWPLALAAYNGGEGRVRRALVARQGKTFTDIARDLSLETQMYVPRVEGVVLRYEGALLGELPSASR
jgi:membrane-bound lytic murein transglycosylase D